MAIRADRIATLFQELLTVIVRIRADRQPVAQLDHFRQQVRGAVAGAEEEAQRRGYSRADTTLAAQAVVAFLDESILNSPSPALRDWVRQPLGPAYFQQHVAGEVFFHNVKELLAGEDSPRTADLLEVYQLALLLGYRGRFGQSRDGDVKMITDRVAEKIQRIRNGSPLLAPEWGAGAEAAPRGTDVWGQRLQYAAVGSVGLLAVFLILYWLVLRSAAGSLVALAAGGAGNPG